MQAKQTAEMKQKDEEIKAALLKHQNLRDGKNQDKELMSEIEMLKEKLSQADETIKDLTEKLLQANSKVDQSDYMLKNEQENLKFTQVEKDNLEKQVQELTS